MSWMVRPLHYGYFWPFWGELLYFVLGIGATLLAMSGMLIWAGREKRKVIRRTGDAAINMERANAAVMGGLLVSLAVMASLNATARATGSSAFSFLGGQDLLAGKPLAPELILFVLL